MEIGRNIRHNDATSRYYLTVRYNFENQIRTWSFDTHRKAARKFNELRKSAVYFDAKSDPSI